MPKQNQMDKNKLNRTEWPSTSLLAYTQRVFDTMKVVTTTKEAPKIHPLQIALLHSEGFSELTGFLICCGVCAGQFEDVHDGIEFMHQIRNK